MSSLVHLRILNGDSLEKEHLKARGYGMAVRGKPLKWFPGFEAALNPNLKVGENER
ncbi:MAG TPA: hypothetical protein VLB68_09100 [Pyrinomonadaceae bacterium]|nr:hypothetical protein [Pyrinomonadaceae bacterium]